MSARSRPVFVVGGESVAADLRELLARLGFELCAHDPGGADALARIREARPDVVVVDGERSREDLAGSVRGVLGTPVVVATRPLHAEALRAGVELALLRHDTERRLREADRRLEDSAASLRERTAELERARSLLGAALDATEDGLLVVDRRGRIAQVNRRFVEIWGMPADVVATQSQAAYREWSAALVVEPGAWQQRIDEITAHPERASVDAFTLRDGRVIERYVRPQLLGGSVVGHVVSLRDVTARVRREEELRASGQRFRAIFEQAAVGVAEIDTATGRFVQINRKYEEIIGWTREEMPALDFMRITHPDDLAPDLAQMERLKRGELREFSMEKRLLRKDGSVFWVNLSVSPLWAPGEAPTHHIAVVQDIEERKRAEARFAGVFESAPDALLLVDHDGRIVLANRVAEQTFGCDREELLRLSVEELVPPPARTAHVELRREFQRRPLSRQMTSSRSRLWAVRRNGERFPAEIALSPLASAEGPLVVAAVRDVTERARAEEQRAALEEQLRQAQKMDALGTLAGGIAHDFNNLLTTIVLSSDLMRHEVGPSHPAVEHLDAVDAASSRAQQLIRQILAFSRRQSSNRAVASLRPLVEEVALLLRASIPAGLRLVTEVSGDVPQVLADSTQLHQVLVNLGTNAWHAIDRPTGQITFRLDAISVQTGSSGSARLAPGRYARLQVIDDGTGMEPAVVARIFEPFFTTKPVGKGTGLGLAIVHRIVSDHGGVIKVDSAAGCGTTFSIYLPEASGADEAPAAAGPKEAPDAGGDVLLVDDDALLLRSAARSLGQLGYRVSAFSRAAEALDAVRADPGRFDVVVTDQNMPEMSGLALAREVARLRPDLPVILVSGNLAHTDAELAAANVRYLLDVARDLI